MDMHAILEPSLIGTETPNLWKISNSNPSRNSFPFDGESTVREPGGGIWATQRAERIITLFAKLGVENLLDVGASDGRDGALFFQTAGISLFGLEPQLRKAQSLANEGIRTIHGELDDLDVLGEIVPNISLLDVLEYVPNDGAALKLLYRVLKPGGHIVITVPAIKSLFSNYDIGVGNLRRYSKSEISSLLKGAGFTNIQVSGLFSFLVPFAFLRRIFPNRALDDSYRGASILDLIEGPFKLACKVEEWLRVSWGLSLLVSASKPLRSA